MRRPSSIFSFNTLRGPWPLPMAGLVALGFVLLAEGAARCSVARGWLAVDASLRELVTGSLITLRRDHPDTWLLGNSTLAAGVDARVVSDAVGGPVAKLPHGSATVRAMAAMLDFYLCQTGAKPGQVLVFATKDDLNPNGYRAEISRAYLDIQRQNRIPAGRNWLMLHTARGAIRMEFISFRRRLASLFGSGEQAAATPVFSGAAIPEADPWFNHMAREFSVDAEAFSQLEEVCRRHSVKRCVVVLLPVTDVLVRFHDLRHPHRTHQEIRREVASLCQEHGLELLDWSEPVADYRLFADAYHLNEDGKRWLSQRLAGCLAATP